MPKNNNIGIFSTGSLGDMLMTLPAIHLIQQLHPNEKFILIKDHQIEKQQFPIDDFFENLDFFKKFVFYKVSSSKTANLVEKTKLLSTLRALKIHTLYYLAPSRKSLKQSRIDSRFFKLAGIKKIIGLLEKGDEINSNERPMPTLDQEADLILSRLSKDGIDIPENGQGSMNLKISSQEKETVKNWGKSNLDPNANYYILSPGAMASVKQWDIANYIGLARRLYDEHNLLPLINGIKADHALAEQICNKIPEAVNACGLFSIRETVAVMAEGKFYLGNDGGGMHMAVCAGLKCVAIFSARDFPGKWYPYGNGHFVHRSTVPCEGCWLDDCIEQKNVCLKNIEINDVFQSCIKLI